MKRHNQILIAILVLQILIGAFIFWPRETVASGSGETLLAGFDAQEVRSISIEDGEGERLILTEEEGDWILTEAGNFPCQSFKVDEFLVKVAAVRSDGIVTETASSHQRLKVASDEFERKIEFSMSDGDVHTLYIGSSPSFGAAHIRLEGEAETYLTSELTARDALATATSWIDTSYFSVPQEDLQTLTLQNEHVLLIFEKDDEGNWTLRGLADDEELQTASVTNIINRATSVTMLEPLGVLELPDYGFDEPSSVVLMQTGEKSISLHVGTRDPEDGSYIVRSSESSYFVRVSEFSVKDLVEKTRADFVQEKPTPTAQPIEETSQPTTTPTP
jgi:hypothetical protein